MDDKVGTRASANVDRKMLRLKSLWAQLRAKKPEAYTMEMWGELEGQAIAGKLDVDKEIANLAKEYNEITG
jgi:hypothetical protein